MALRAGFIGLGNIGKPLAARLVGAGFETTVHDLAEAPVRELVEAGAKAASSPRALAAAADVVGVCVRDDDDVRAVCLGPEGILAGAVSGCVVVLHSTILPGTAREIGAAAGERGVFVLDACVTGGAARVAQGTAIFLVGGDREPLERARPLLEASSQHIIHAGPLGNGCKLKLCINLVTYLQWTAAYEAAALARAVDLPLELFEEAGRANGQVTDLMVQYLALHKLPEAVLKGEALQRTLRGHRDVAEKDLAWTLRLAREAGVSLPGTALASQLMARIYGVEEPKRR